MKNWSKKFLLALCLVLMFAVTAVAEEVLPGVTVTVAGNAVEVTGDVMQPALNVEGDLTDSVTVTLTKSAEGVWNVTGVGVSATPAENTAEDSVALELVTAAGVCAGVETIVPLENAGLTVAVYTADDLTKADVTVNATAVAAAMGEGYTVGDLKATTVTFTTVDGVTSVKVAFDIVAPAVVENAHVAVENTPVAEENTPVAEEPATVVIAYIDPDNILQSYRLTAQVGDPTPAYPGDIPVREGFEFGGWTNGWMGVNPVVKGDEVYEAIWLEYFTVTYFDWYDQKVLAEFVVLEGQPTPTIDPDRYTKSSYVNMGFTTAIAPTVTGDVTYTMMQMVPPRENNVSGISFVCTCPNNDDHCKTFAYSSTLANYLRIDDISEDVYFDGTNYKCVVYLQDDMTQFNTYYNGRFTKVKNSHTFVSRDISSFTVTFNMDTKRWVADTSAINVQYVCPTAPVANATTIKSTKINVQCPDLNKKLFGIYLDASTVSFGQVTGSYAEGEWYVTVTVNSFDPYIEAFEAKYGVDVTLDAAATGAVTYTFKYTLASHGLVHSDGSNWVLQETTYVVNNGKTVYVTSVTE